MLAKDHFLDSGVPFVEINEKPMGDNPLIFLMKCQPVGP